MRQSITGVTRTAAICGAAAAGFFLLAHAGYASRDKRADAGTSANPTFTQANLVSDVSGMAKTTDANLINPWGLALGINSGIWVSNQGSKIATTYDGAGNAIPSASPVTVTITAPAGGSSASSPTGVATNASGGFVISAGGKAAPATQVFATLDGTIAGWNPTVNPTQSVVVVDNSSTGASYTGLAIGFNGSGSFFFAANFHAGTVDVFDSNFQPVRTPNAFQDPQLPAGYAPFGIASINSKVYVTYALQDANKKQSVPGAGHGFIDIFDTRGKLEKR